MPFYFGVRWQFAIVAAMRLAHAWTSMAVAAVGITLALAGCGSKKRILEEASFAAAGGKGTVMAPKGAKLSIDNRSYLIQDGKDFLVRLYRSPFDASDEKQRCENAKYKNCTIVESGDDHVITRWKQAGKTVHNVSAALPAGGELKSCGSDSAVGVEVELAVAKQMLDTCRSFKL
jgi:hypothetical protein